MPFWTNSGGLYVPDAPGGKGPLKEIQLDRAHMYSFSDGKLDREVLFEGNPDNADLNYGNKTPKFRLWTKGWTKEQWAWLLKFLDEEADPDNGVMVPKYPQFASRIFYTPAPYDILPGSDDALGADWVYPIFVLRWLIEKKKITSPQQIAYIERRAMEEEGTLNKSPQEVMASLIKEEVMEKRKQILPEEPVSMLKETDPEGEFEDEETKKLDAEIVVDTLDEVEPKETIIEDEMGPTIKKVVATKKG